MSWTTGLVILVLAYVGGILHSPVIWPKIKQAWQYFKDRGGW